MHRSFLEGPHFYASPKIWKFSIPCIESVNLCVSIILCTAPYCVYGMIESAWSALVLGQRLSSWPVFDWLTRLSRHFNRDRYDTMILAGKKKKKKKKSKPFVWK